MNKALIAFSLVLTAALWSCKTDAPVEDKSKTLSNSKEDVKWSFYNSGDLFLKVMADKNDQGANKILRGMNIGDHPDSLIVKEKGMRQVDEKVMKGYFQDLNDAEFISSYYYFNEEDFLTGANVKVNLASDSTAEDLYFELKLYFEQKYGKSFHGLDKYDTWNALTVDSFPFVIGLKFEKGIFPVDDKMEPEFSKVIINLEESDY
ncbi:MAG: hypothetical protein NT150_13130 [Bacteroidetes bacterium]|nr:hypothetical protein [Bacteroidota bacterium]